jgi:hypothetical protein
MLKIKVDHSEDQRSRSFLGDFSYLKGVLEKSNKKARRSAALRSGDSFLLSQIG